MKNTDRDVGPVEHAEVLAFQRAFPTLQADGKVGNQTWGQVMILLEEHKQVKEQLRKIHIVYKKRERVVELYWFIALTLAIAVGWCLSYV